MLSASERHSDWAVGLLQSHFYVRLVFEFAYHSFGGSELQLIAVEMKAAE